MQPIAEHEAREPEVEVSGTWEIDVRFVGHMRRHRVSLVAHAGTVTGYQNSHKFSGPVTGHIRGSTLHLFFEAAYQAAIITYQFEGCLVDDELSGEVILGSATKYSRGEVNYGQYGKAKWRGKRVAA